MRCSVGSGPMPEAEGGAAPPPVAPDTLRKRRRATRPAPDELMAPEAGLHRGNAGLTRDRDRRMTVEARNPVLPGVDVVPEEDRLAGTIQVSRVADDGSVLG